MLLLKYYYQLIIKHDLTNKFLYNNSKNIPKIEKITLNFGYNVQNFNLKSLATAMLSLELITKQKGKVTLLKTPKVSVKIRKGHPVGCKITLRKNSIYEFVFQLLTDALPKTKNFLGITVKKRLTNAISFKFTNASAFNELEKHHNIFKNLPVLDVTFVTNTRNRKELLHLLYSHKLPVALKNLKMQAK